MGKNEDDRGALARDTQRVRAALDDLASLMGNRRQRRRGMNPPARNSDTPAPRRFDVPPASASTGSVPLSTPDCFFAEFAADDSGQLHSQDEESLRFESQLPDSDPPHNSDELGWFADPLDPSAIASPAERGLTAELENSWHEVANVTPSDQHDTQEAPHMESKRAQPHPSTPPGESIDDVLDGFNW
jgi:hypothetical protein